jgi:hypothetical protein
MTRVAVESASVRDLFDMPIPGVTNTTATVRPFSSIAQKAFDACNGLLAAQTKSLTNGLISHSVLKALSSYKPAHSPLALYQAKNTGLDDKDFPPKRQDVALAASAARNMARRTSEMSNVSNFVQLVTETLHHMSTTTPLSDVDLADQNLLTLGLMIASRDLSVMTAVQEVNWRLIQRDTLLAAATIPKEVKTKVSLDLSDAYLHVPMHHSTRKYLRFAIDDRVYTFHALPFGLSTSPWVFTRVMNAVVSETRRHTSSPISNYLDDRLQRHQDPTILTQDLQFLLRLLTSLGFKVNLQKSDLAPAQSFSHLGMFFQTVPYTVAPCQKRIDKIIALVHELSQARSTTPRKLQSLVGCLVSVADLVHLGGLYLRPVQWAMADWWSPTSDSWDSIRTLSPALKAALRVRTTGSG